MQASAWRNEAKGYAVAAGGTVASILTCLAFPWMQQHGSGALLLITVLVSTWIGGWRAGVFAMATTFMVRIYFLAPSHSFRVESNLDWVRTGMLMSVEGLTVAILEGRASALARLSKSQGRLTAALTAARMGAWEKDLNTGAFWWSSGMEEIFGRRPGTFVPTYDDFLGYIHPDDRGFVSNAFTKSVKDGTTFEIEHRIVRPEGTARWIVTRGQIFYDAAGHAERLLGVAADITDRKDLPSQTDVATGEHLAAYPGRL